MPENSQEKYRVRVPVILQMEALECGAACLAMVMAYYGKWVPLEEVRRECGVSRNGSNAKNMLLAARGFGFDAEGLRCEPETLQGSAGLPCILHWNFNHYVVLTGFRGGHAFLNDPARGEVRVSLEELDRSFTGVALRIVPGPEFVPSGSRRSMLSFAAERLKGTGPAAAFVLLTTVCASLFGIIQPVFSRFFIDRLLTGENRELLYPFLMLMFFVGFLQIISVFLESVWSLRISGKIAVSGSGVFLWKLLRLPMEFYAQRLTGDLLKRQDTNATIADTLVGTFAPLLIHAGMMVLYLFLMLRTSVLLTAVGAAAMLLHLLVSQIIAAKRINITRVRLRDSGRLAAATLSGIQMAETIKAAGAENGFFAQWSGIQAAMNRQNVRYSFLNRSLGMIPSALSALAGALVLILGVLLTMQGRFTLGMILLFQGFLNGFMDPVRTIITAGQSLQEMRSDMERIEDVLAYPDDPAFAAAPADGTEEYAKLSGDVELRNVTFGYSPLEPPLIRDFSMHVKPGSRVAFVGPSGCGKSTLAKLISGLYRPWSGEILFDKKPASSIDRSVFTGSVAVADQEIILFEGTVADNIRMWDTSIEDFEMILAARDAQIYDDIMAREGGFSSLLSEGGKNLSGGQRQRLEIARVLAQDPSVIILDEATSALDAATEAELMRAVKDRGITCILIAHRLSTIRDCDEIIVLDRGRAVERGTHRELLEAGGMYAGLIAND